MDLERTSFAGFFDFWAMITIKILRLDWGIFNADGGDGRGGSGGILDGDNGVETGAKRPV